MNPNRYIELELELKRLVEEQKRRDLTPEEIEFVQDAQVLLRFNELKEEQQ